MIMEQLKFVTNVMMAIPLITEALQISAEIQKYFRLEKNRLLVLHIYVN